MIIVVYFGLDMKLSSMQFSFVLNCLIHVFMYSYFTFNAYNGYRPWWRTYLTRTQIFQFLLQITHALIYSIFFTECIERIGSYQHSSISFIYGWMPIIFAFFFMFSLVFMFATFYLRTKYLSTGKKSTKQA